MVVGYGWHGEAGKAVQCFRAMVDLGFRPDNITFLAVLSPVAEEVLWMKGLAFFATWLKIMALGQIARKKALCILGVSSRSCR